MHEDLVVPRICIHEAEKLMACRCVNKLVYLREREAILGTSTIEIGVFHTHALTTLGLVNHGYVGQP